MFWQEGIYGQWDWIICMEQDMESAILKVCMKDQLV